jgi:ABC-type oligopeptide transport system substrate-binding subunit
MNWYFCDPYGNTLHQLGFGATMMSWDMDYPDPGDYLSTALSPTSHVNTGGYQDPTFDTLIARATTDPDAAERVRLYRQAEHRLLAQAAVIPLRISRPEWTISRAVSGLTGRAPTGPIPVPPGADWSRLRVP